MNKIRYYLLMGAFAILACVIILAMIKVIKGPSEAKITIGVMAQDGYEPETEEAMDLWNGYVGCKFLVPGDDTLVKSDDGEACGDLWRPEEEWGHAATSYRCKDGKSQILLSQPGTSWMQTWTIAHELGHTLKEFGVEHASIGVMGKTPLDDGGKPPIDRS